MNSFILKIAAQMVDGLHQLVQFPGLTVDAKGQEIGKISLYHGHQGYILMIVGVGASYTGLNWMIASAYPCPSFPLLLHFSYHLCFYLVSFNHSWNARHCVKHSKRPL